MGKVVDLAGLLVVQEKGPCWYIENSMFQRTLLVIFLAMIEQEKSYNNKVCARMVYVY